MDIQQADKAAEKHLINDVTDIVMGRMVLAARSHSAVEMTTMGNYKESEVNPNTVAAHIFDSAGFWPHDQAQFFIGFRFQETNLQADIYPKDDIAIIWDVEEVQVQCKMTVTNFWRFLNTIPNMYQFAIPNGNPMRVSEEGMFFLSYFSETN